MVTLQIGWCKNCSHKIALHPKKSRWMHFSLGRGYLLTLNCYAYAGSTNTSFDLGALKESQFKCECVEPALDEAKEIQKKHVLW